MRASAKRETLAARLAIEHEVKGSVRVPVTIVEELLAQATVSSPEGKAEETASAPEGATAAAAKESEVAHATEEEPDGDEPARDDAENPPQPERARSAGTFPQPPQPE